MNVTAGTRPIIPPDIDLREKPRRLLNSDVMGLKKWP